MATKTLKSGKETKAERTARQEVERMEGVASRRAAKSEEATQKLDEAKARQKDIKKKRDAKAKKSTKAKAKKGKGTRKKTKLKSDKKE